MSRNYQNSDEARPWAAGPWCVTTCADYWVEPAEPPDDDGFYGIAHCGDIDWPGYHQKQREWEANARLISASPELYEALWLCVAALEEHGVHTGGIPDPECSECAALAAARQALAKANPEKGDAP